MRCNGQPLIRFRADLRNFGGPPNFRRIWTHRFHRPRRVSDYSLILRTFFLTRDNVLLARFLRRETKRRLVDQHADLAIEGAAMILADVRCGLAVRLM